MKKSRWLKKCAKKCTAAFLAVTVGVTGSMMLSPRMAMETEAMTDKTMDEYDEIVSTYSVDASVPDYKAYVANYPNAAHPDASIVIDAADYVRYEEENAAVQPQL